MIVVLSVRNDTEITPNCLQVVLHGGQDFQHNFELFVVRREPLFGFVESLLNAFETFVDGVEAFLDRSSKLCDVGLRSRCCVILVCHSAGRVKDTKTRCNIEKSIPLPLCVVRTRRSVNLEAAWLLRNMGFVFLRAIVRSVAQMRANDIRNADE